MEILPVLRLIWRRRILLVIATVAAIAVFVGLGGTKPASSSSAVAWTRVTLDTPKSQLVDVASSGSDTLTWRSALLTHVMAAEGPTRAIARRFGVRADEVNVVDSDVAVPLDLTWLALNAAKSTGEFVRPYVVTLFVKDSSLPVISLEAAAPNRRDAVRLANAAVAVLESQSSPGGRVKSRISTAGGTGSGLQPFTVAPVAPVRVKLFTASSISTKAIAAAFLVLVASCIAGSLLSRVSRRLSARDRALPA